ncbi:uncharacterized protein TNCV_4196551 [Trichonephila clavipes]|nr:uncharacterized protein TNCV_4196551 [Trichonephila clavipes]
MIAGTGSVGAYSQKDGREKGETMTEVKYKYQILPQKAGRDDVPQSTSVITKQSAGVRRGGNTGRKTGRPKAVNPVTIHFRTQSERCSAVQLNHIVKREFPNEPYHITLKDNAVPVISPPRRVPLALQPKLKKKPNGNLRLCLDPKDLNKLNKREHYQIPCTDDIISRLEGKKIFLVVDLKDGFWHVLLDEVSPEICTFNTPFRSDEAHFWLNGYVNKQNRRIWSEANPQVYVEIPLHPEKLTVWCALWAGGIIGPYFFKNDEGHNVTVNGDRYRAMITNFFIPELNNHDVQELWFQQDGAICQTARATIDLLKDTFGDRLISRFGPVNWPP